MKIMDIFTVILDMQLGFEPSNSDFKKQMPPYDIPKFTATLLPFFGPLPPPASVQLVGQAAILESCNEDE
jgi:hypothetical protein